MMVQNSPKSELGTGDIPLLIFKKKLNVSIMDNKEGKSG
jgi:hypothetical protein